MELTQEQKNIIWTKYFPDKEMGICPCCKFTLITKDNFTCINPLPSVKNKNMIDFNNAIPACDICNTNNIYETVSRKQHHRPTLSSIGFSKTNTTPNTQQHSNALELGLKFMKDRQYDEMKKYFLQAIDENNSDAAYHLGCYYKEQHDYANMKKYLLVAARAGHVDASDEIGYFYYYHHNYNLAKKYFLSAYESGYIPAAYGLALCHKKCSEFDLMVKYLTVCSDGDIMVAKYELGKYYKKLNDFENMKHFWKTIANYHSRAAYHLGRYYQKQQDFDRMKKFYLKSIELYDQSALAKLNDYYAHNMINVKISIGFECDIKPNVEVNEEIIKEKIIPLQKIFM